MSCGTWLFERAAAGMAGAGILAWTTLNAENLTDLLLREESPSLRGETRSEELLEILVRGVLVEKKPVLMRLVALVVVLVVYKEYRSDP